MEYEHYPTKDNLDYNNTKEWKENKTTSINFFKNARALGAVNISGNKYHLL